MFPNGTVITPDGRTLVIGETRAQRLTAFDRAADGTLSNRRVWADLGAHYPDAICLDAEAATWVADPRNNVAVRMCAVGMAEARRVGTEGGSTRRSRWTRNR